MGFVPGRGHLPGTVPSISRSCGFFMSILQPALESDITGKKIDQRQDS